MCHTRDNKRVTSQNSQEAILQCFGPITQGQKKKQGTHSGPLLFPHLSVNQCVTNDTLHHDDHRQILSVELEASPH